jgi:hypothetical protein
VFAVGFVDEEGSNRLPAEELRHRAGILSASPRGAKAPPPQGVGA